MRFAFEDFEFDTSRLELRRAGSVCHLEPQVFDLLHYLLEHHDRVVTKNELLDAIWPGRFVSDSALSSRIKAARQAIGDSGSSQRLIKTHHGRGFRFIGPLRLNDDGESARTPDRAPSAAAAFRQGQTLVGREGELMVLHDRLDEALRGSRQTIFIGAEAGCGKTAIVSAFESELLMSRRATLVRGQCMRQFTGGGEPYQAIVELVESISRSFSPDRLAALLEQYASSWIAEMPWLIPADRRDKVLSEARRSTVGTTSDRMQSEVVRLLEAVACDQPLVLVIEDLHWSDPSTLDVLRRLAVRTMSARLLVIGTYRPADVRAHGHLAEKLQHDLRIHGRCVQLGLGPFSPPDIHRYLHERTGVVPPIGLADSLHSRTAGIPLYVEVVLNNWLASEGERWWQKSQDELIDAIPRSLEGLLIHVVSELDTEDRMLLEVASICGERFDVARLCAAAGRQDDQNVEARMDALAHSGRFIKSVGSCLWPDGTWTEQYEFSHVLYQEALYDRIPVIRRAGLHLAVAHRLESGYAERAGEIAAQIAEHLFLGGRADLSITHFRRAAEHALRRNAHLEATQHLARAINQLSVISEVASRDAKEIVLRLMHARAMIALEGWASVSAEQDLERILELCTRSGEEESRSRALYHLAVIYEFRGEFSRAQNLIEDRIERLGSDDVQANLESHELLACSRYHQGAFREAIKYASQALHLYDPSYHVGLTASVGENPGVSCHNWTALSTWFTGAADEAVAESERAILLARAASHSFSLASALAMAAVLRHYRREPAKTQILAEAAEILARAHGFRYFEAVGMILRGWARHERTGDSDAIEVIREGLGALKGTGALMDLPYFKSLLAEAYLRSGFASLASETIEDAIAIVDRSRAYCYEAELHRIRGDILDASGNSADAVTSYERASQIAAEQGARLPELRATHRLSRLLASQRRHNEAAGRLACALERFDPLATAAEVVDARLFFQTLIDSG
jgi:predicted ATPase/DNA-binding winged helix-turn-helix (wHTH) protein